jgi:hypothetical protein
MSTLHERLKRRTSSAETTFQKEKQKVQDTNSAQIASRLDNPINSPSASQKIADRQFAQTYAELNNSKWFEQYRNELGRTQAINNQSAQIASRLDGGSYATNAGKQATIAQQTKNLKSAQVAANLDNSLMGQATRYNQKASFERAMESLYNQMEIAKGANNMQDYTRAQDRYSNISKMLQDLENPTSTAAYAADWENRMRTEIMSTDDRVLMPKLERLLELADARMREASDRGDERRNGLTETEKQYNAIYNSLKNQYGDQVDGWIEYAKRMDNKAKMQERLEQTRQEAKDKKFGSSAKSVPLNMLSGAGYMDIVAQKMQRGIAGSAAPIDYNSDAQSASKMVNTIRSTASEDMGKVGSFLYNTAMSMADTLVAMPLGNAGMAMLGGAAATNAMQAAVERGASDNQALAVGLLAGAMETVMEKASVDSLFNLKTPEAAKEVVLNALKQAGAEGTEEGLTTIANTLADALIMGNRSELQTQMRELIAQGYSEAEAKKMALKEWGQNLLLDVAGGALSGGMFGSVKSGIDSVMPKLKQEAQAQPTVADITPTPQRAQEAPATSPVTKVEEVQPVQSQTTSERKVSDVVSRITGENKTEQAETTVETAAQAEPTIEFADGTKQTQAEFVEAYRTEFPRASEAEAVKVFRQYENLNENGIKVPAFASEETKAQPEATETEPGVKPAVGAIGDMGAKTSEFPHEVKESRGKTIPRYNEQNNIPNEGRADNHYTERTWAEARNNARVRLEQDYSGEVEELARKTTWSDEEVFEAEAILHDLQEKARKTDDWSEHQKWAKVFTQHGEELGRALNALRGVRKNTAETILADASASLENAAKDTDINAVMKEVDAYATRYEVAAETKNIDELLKIIRDTSVTRKTGTRDGGLSKDVEWALNRVADYARAEMASAKQAGSSDMGRFYDFLQNFAANGIKAIATDKQTVSFGQGYRTIQSNSILSKLVTVMRNLVSNGVLDPLDSFAGNLSVPLDMALSKFTKTRSVAYDRSWFSEAKRKGSLDAMAMALLEVGLDVNAENKASRYENIGKRTFHMANGGIAKFLSGWEKYSGYTLNVTDEFSKGGTEAEVQRGIDRLYELNKIKDDTLRDAGKQAALYRTLQDETVPSKVVTGIRKGLNHAQIGGLGLGDVTIKFAQVPANLPARAADFSPVGLVRGLGKMAKVLIDAKNGKLTAAQQASAVKDIGRGITGSGLILASTALALKGIIHVVAPGGEDENKDKAASEQAQGLKETQLNLSALLRSIKGEDTTWRYGDKMVSFGFLDPINAHLMTGALIAEDIEEARKAGEKIGLGDILTDSLQGTIHALLDLPLMDPIKDMRYAWQKSDGDNEVEKAWDVAKQGVAGEVTSFIPNALKGIAQGVDPYQRDMYSKDDLVGRTVDQIIGSIPKWRETLPIKQDVYGNDIENPKQPLNFMNANILPGAITTYTETDLQKALNDLSEQSGKNSMYLSKDAPKYITVDDERIDLTYEQQREFNTVRGDTYEATSAALEKSSVYQGLSREMKESVYAHAEDYAVQTAKDGLGVGFKPDTWVSDLKGADAETITNTLVAKAIESQLGTGSKKYEGMADYAADGDLEAVIKLMLTDAQAADYDTHIEKADVSLEVFLDALAFASEAKSDKKDGETVPGSKKAKVEDYINSLDLSKQQKTALYLSMPDDYSQKTMPKWQ